MFSYESVKLWLKRAFPRSNRRMAVAVDETKLKLKGEQLFIWLAGFHGAGAS